MALANNMPCSASSELSGELEARLLAIDEKLGKLLSFHVRDVQAASGQFPAFAALRRSSLPSSAAVTKLAAEPARVDELSTKSQGCEEQKQGDLK